jgi:hypothetical protein
MYPETIKKQLKAEKDAYEAKKKAFYAEPMNWTNNKRKMMGLPTLRGAAHRHRKTTYPPFRISPQLYLDIMFFMEGEIKDKLEIWKKEYMEMGDINEDLRFNQL